MWLSIIICTYNRAEVLKETLLNLLKVSNSAAKPYEILVIDNNSKDHTPDVVEALQGQYQNKLRYIYENQQGLSFARNRGIKEAKGEILAYVDDDVSFDTRWLDNIEFYFKNPNCLGIGGRIIPQWPNHQAPWWYDKNLAVAYAGITGELNLGQDPKEFKVNHSTPYGGNMIFRKEVFQRYGEFHTDLGRKGNDFGLHEDSEFANRILKDQQKLFYAPDVIVFHRVFKERITRKYLARWWYRSGKQNTRLKSLPLNTCYLLGVPRFLLRTLCMYILKTLKCFLTFRLRTAFLWEMRTLLILGEITGYYQQHKLKSKIR